MERRFVLARLSLVVLLLACLAIATVSTTWYVDGVNGNDKNNCNTPQTACKTIRHAVKLASSGDSIIIAAAIYKQFLNINISLKLIGAGAAATIIDGGNIYIGNTSARVIVSKMTISHGGGINNSGTLTVNDSTISGNGSRGGVSNDGTITLNRCTVSGNIGDDGYFSSAGGIDNEGSTAVINDSTISENSAVGDYVCGGGIYNTGTLTITNSTLTGNHARGAANSNGGGIDNEGGTVVLNNSTLSGNKAGIYLGHYGYGGGIANGGCVMNGSYFGTVHLQNSIVANSPKGGNCSGTLTSQGYNLSSDKTCNFNGTGDLNNTVPKLGKLGSYGGPTQTIPLLSGSPAIDAGNPAGCTDGQGHLLKTDQRGRRRPDKEDTGGCDMGAYERQTD